MCAWQRLSYFDNVGTAELRTAASLYPSSSSLLFCPSPVWHPKIRLIIIIKPRPKMFIIGHCHKPSKSWLMMVTVHCISGSGMGASCVVVTGSIQDCGESQVATTKSSGDIIHFLLLVSVIRRGDSGFGSQPICPAHQVKLVVPLLGVIQTETFNN